MLVGELDVELADRPPRGRDAHAGAMGRHPGPAGAGTASRRRARDAAGASPRLLVALDDLVDVDVSPAAGLAVDDAEDHGLTHELADIPRRPVELLGAAGPVVRSGGGPHDLAVEQQVETRRARIPPTADQEVEIGSLDPERAGRSACRSTRRLRRTS